MFLYPLLLLLPVSMFLLSLNLLPQFAESAAVRVVQEVVVQVRADGGRAPRQGQDEDQFPPHGDSSATINYLLAICSTKRRLLTKPIEPSNQDEFNNELRCVHHSG